jgi:hypothetical protein
MAEQNRMAMTLARHRHFCSKVNQPVIAGCSDSDLTAAFQCQGDRRLITVTSVVICDLKPSGLQPKPHATLSGLFDTKKWIKIHCFADAGRGS